MANEFARPEIADLLLTYGQRFIEELGCSINNSPISLFGSTTVPEQAENMSEKPEDLIKRFYSKYSPDHANLELIVEVLGCSESYSQSGTVLVYLPAYSDVIELRDMIAASSSQLKKKLEVHVLHGHLPLKEFNNLYLPVADGRRKVILTTSIAETGINFEDVTCVIDYGLVRDRENDAVMISPRRTQWICKAAAQQRSSHIRRGGLIFNLYPRSRIDGMHDFPVPEITRDSIVDVCLYARLLIPSDMRLSQFFCSLPDGPPTTAVHEAVRVLTSIDAIDSQQKVYLMTPIFFIFDKFYILYFLSFYR
jgi:HrpA-like RNA helicase